MRYYINNNLICFLAAVLIAVAVNSLVVWRLKKRWSIKDEKAQKVETQKALSYTLSINNNLVKLFGDVFSADNYDVTYYKKVFTATKNGKKRLIYPCFVMRPISSLDILEVAAQTQCIDITEVVIFTSAADIDISSVMKPIHLTLKIYDIASTADFLISHNAMPQLIAFDAMKNMPPQFFAAALRRSRSKYYFWSSLFLLLTSFVAFFPVYYIIFGTILFALSLYSRFNVRFNSVETDKALFD
ncbi:MAG: hypothetical protein RR054_04300 [Clostridia bacterium]